MYKWLIIISVKVFFYREYRLLELNFKKEDFITNISNVYVTASDIIFFLEQFLLWNTLLSQWLNGAEILKSAAVFLLLLRKVNCGKLIAVKS